MIILNDTGKSLEVLLAGAVTTTALPVEANWVDVRSSDQGVSQFGATDGAATGTGAVTVAGAPNAGFTRTVKSLTVYNADIASATVTVQYRNGSTTRILVKILLAVGSTLEYVE